MITEPFGRVSGWGPEVGKPCGRIVGQLVVCSSASAIDLFYRTVWTWLSDGLCEWTGIEKLGKPLGRDMPAATPYNATAAMLSRLLLSILTWPDQSLLSSRLETPPGTRNCKPPYAAKQKSFCQVQIAELPQAPHRQHSYRSGSSTNTNS